MGFHRSAVRAGLCWLRTPKMRGPSAAARTAPSGPDVRTISASTRPLISSLLLLETALSGWRPARGGGRHPGGSSEGWRGGREARPHRAAPAGVGMTVARQSGQMVWVKRASERSET